MFTHRFRETIQETQVCVCVLQIRDGGKGEMNQFITAACKSEIISVNKHKNLSSELDDSWFTFCKMSHPCSCVNPLLALRCCGVTAVGCLDLSGAVKLTRTC